MFVQSFRTFSPTNKRVGERVRHVNEHVRIFWDWKQIYVVFGISSLKVTMNTALPSKPCSLCDPGDPRPIVSQHTRQTRKHHSPLLHDKTNFRFQWLHTGIRHPWLNGSYKALEVFPFGKKKTENTFWSPEMVDPNTPPAASTATEQDALARNKETTAVT